jgi:hypothetical protein
MRLVGITDDEVATGVVRRWVERLLGGVDVEDTLVTTLTTESPPPSQRRTLKPSAP